MIENEILEIIQGATADDDRLNDVVDEFRRGRRVDDIMVLLESSNAELVSIGAWILGELDFTLYGAPQYVNRLRELTDHEDPSVRFHALGALFPALESSDPDTQALLRKLRVDRNEGVRRGAEAALARLSMK